jgi:hypothetical protein
MQVSSYTFKSPYPQAVQVGQPDPSSAKKEEAAQNEVIEEKPRNTSVEGKVKPTLDSGITISVSALKSGNSQESVSEFKALNNLSQAQKAYVQ